MKNTDQRESYLEKQYKNGLEFASALTDVWQIYAKECCKLLSDKEALQAFCEPVGWGGRTWGLAAERFPQFFFDIKEEDQLTAQQLMALSKFCKLPVEKCQELFNRWEKDARNWDLWYVDEQVALSSKRNREDNKITTEAEVSYSDRTINAKVPEDISIEPGNYVLRMRRKKDA